MDCVIDDILPALLVFGALSTGNFVILGILRDFGWSVLYV